MCLSPSDKTARVRCPSRDRVIRFPLGGQSLDAVGDGDGVVPVVGVGRGGLGAALCFFGLLGGGDGGVHRLVDPRRVPAHPALGVVPDENWLPEGDLLAQCLGFVVCGLRVRVAPGRWAVGWGGGR